MQGRNGQFKSREYSSFHFFFIFPLCLQNTPEIDPLVYPNMCADGILKCSQINCLLH